MAGAKEETPTVLSGCDVSDAGSTALELPYVAIASALDTYMCSAFFAFDHFSGSSASLRVSPGLGCSTFPTSFSSDILDSSER